MSDRMAEVREIVDAVRDDEDLTKFARAIKEAMSESRWQGLGDWDQARYAAHLLTAAGFGDVREAKAQALEDAADDYRHYQTPNARLYLRARAAAVRGEG